MGNDLRNRQNEMEDMRAKEERRRKKLERQEKRVERLNEPIFAWLCKTFRVVTIAGTVLFSLVKLYQGMQLGVDNLALGVLFNALATWTVFGLVWAGSAVAQAILLKKNGEGDANMIRSYWRDAGIAVTGMVLLLAAVLMCL